MNYFVWFDIRKKIIKKRIDICELYTHLLACPQESVNCNTKANTITLARASAETAPRVDATFDGLSKNPSIVLWSVTF